MQYDTTRAGSKLILMEDKYAESHYVYKLTLVAQTSNLLYLSAF